MKELFLHHGNEYKDKNEYNWMMKFLNFLGISLNRLSYNWVRERHLDIIGTNADGWTSNRRRDEFRVSYNGYVNTLNLRYTPLFIAHWTNTTKAVNDLDKVYEWYLGNGPNNFNGWDDLPSELRCDVRKRFVVEKNEDFNKAMKYRGPSIILFKEKNSDYLARLKRIAIGREINYELTFLSSQDKAAGFKEAIVLR